MVLVGKAFCVQSSSTSIAVNDEVRRHVAGNDCYLLFRCTIPF